MWTGRNVASLRIAVGVVMAIWLFDAVFTMMGPLVNMGKGKPSFISVTPVSSSPTGLFQSFKIYSNWICSTRHGARHAGTPI